MEFTEPVMRPPQEVSSVILQATQGCTHNDCHFCYVTRGYPFMAIKPEKLEQDAMRLKRFFAPNTRIYLAGANPFVLPTRILKEYVAALRKVFPEFSCLAMQSRIDDIARKTDTELTELNSLGLNHLYIGTENGHEDTLRLMNKGHTAKDTVEQLRRLDKAGIKYTNFYVIGLGGKGMGQACALATAKMFNQVHPIRITTTGLTMFKNAPVSEMAKRGEFQEASEREKIEELRTFLANLEIDVFYDGIHYLNPVHYRFQTGDKTTKEQVLADIDEILESYSDADLELMVNRRQMVSL